MATPKFLQNIKTRLFATTATTASTIAATGYLATIPPQQVTEGLATVLGTFTTSLLIATAPQLASAILGIATNLISGDLYERFTKREIYKQIPPEANLYQATFFAFQSILNEVIENEEIRSDKKQIKKFRDISFESWLELVSLDEQEDNITEVVEAILTKFKDEKVIENQFLKGKHELQENLLTRHDWLVLLLRLQGKEESYLTTDLEDKILDALENNYAARLRSVFSVHQQTFQEVTLQLWETLFGKLDRIEGKIDRILDGKSLKTQISKPQGLINISEDGKSFFTEQGSVLEDLETQLKSKHIASLHGKHGLGKTTNAQEFARRQIGNYEFIVFLSAAEQIIETSIIEFADRYVPELQALSLFEREQVQREQKLKLFKTFLEDNQLWQGEKRAWLLIFDNLEKRDHILDFFPKRNHGDILYTCNDDNLWIDDKCEVQIREFSQTEAELFLYKTKDERKDASRGDIPPETLADIQKILSEYGRLPFVLSKFRNYLSEVRISYAAFFEELKNNEQRYLEAFASGVDYQYKNEVIAFSVSFEKVAEFDAGVKDDEIISRLAVALLNISAFCFADQIPEELLKETLFRMVDTSETAVSQDVLFAEAFRKLERFDLLNARTEIFDYLEKKAILDEKENQFTVEYIPLKNEETVYESHRIIQKIVKLKLENEAKTEILNKFIIVLKSFIPYPYLENWKIYEKYLSNVENIIVEAGKLELATEELGFICNQFGYYLGQLAQFEGAIKFYQVALLMAEKTMGKEHPNYATCLSNLALVYRSQGRYDEAIEKYKEVLKIDEQTIGKGHPDYATSLNNLAIVYRERGRYEEAIELYQVALSIDEQTFGKEHPDYATSLNNLAIVYHERGKFDEAIEKYEEVLRITEKTLGKKHPDYATSLANLANVYYSQGRYNEAVEKYKEALEIEEKIIGKEHPSYAISLSSLATVHEIQEKYQDALDLYEEALRINEKALPENHPYNIPLKESVARCRKILGK